jgi:hypothetical protein
VIDTAVISDLFALAAIGQREAVFARRRKLSMQR